MNPKKNYPSPLIFSQTPEEKKDLFLSWQRDDQAFFGAGACHILAYTFYWLHSNEGYEIVYIQPTRDFPGNHVYVCKDGWVFDFAGWTREEEVLVVIKETYTEKYPGWEMEQIVITNMDLETFCKKHNHKAPAYFAYLPWERTHKYIKQFVETFPKND